MNPDNEQKLSRQQLRARDRADRKARDHSIKDRKAAFSDVERQLNLIEEEAQLRGVIRDEREKQIWNLPFSRPRTSDSAREKAAGYVNEMLVRASYSKNPGIIAAIQTVTELAEDKKARVLLQDELPGLLMGTEANLSTDGDIEFRFAISTPGTLLTRHPFQLAAPYAHEAEHLRDMAEFDRTLLHLSPDERLSAHGNRFYDLPTYRKMEARAHGAMSEAIIHHIGMVGIPQYIPDTYIQVASMYVESGCDSSSEGWQNAIVALEAQGLATRIL